jgi:hypothetical protein
MGQSGLRSFPGGGRQGWQRRFTGMRARERSRWGRLRRPQAEGNDKTQASGKSSGVS